MAILTCGQPMKIPGNISKQRMIRLCHALSLIFFACIFVVTCRQKGIEDISIFWNKDKAAGIVIPKRLLTDVPADTISKYLQVRLVNNSTPMLGVFESTDDRIVFKPVIALSPGMSYEVVFRMNVIGRLIIPVISNSGLPYLQAVYPTADTLPENMLKMYLRFSAPMREGEALRHITLLDNNNDTIPDVFLDLQPELWNNERTALTLWLDPGRIKRDLIPNRQMGSPLHQGKQYVLVISSDWKDARGLFLRQSYRKKFAVAARDSLIPQPAQWVVYAPSSKTSQAVQVRLSKPLDYYLLKETIQIINEKGNTVAGKILISGKETLFEFIPDEPWQPGNYRIRVAAHLEDLAGNNLIRPFDLDLQKPQPQNDKKVFERAFEIKL